MLGYLDNPEATARAFTDDGYFKTGDLGYALSEQQFVFQARMGDSLRLAGFLVNPAEIEQVVESLPGVRACQVVGATRATRPCPTPSCCCNRARGPTPRAGPPPARP